MTSSLSILLIAALVGAVVEPKTRLVQSQVEGSGASSSSIRYALDASLSLMIADPISGNAGVAAFPGLIGGFNEPPAPRMDILSLPTGEAPVSVSDLLQNDFDNEGEPLVVSLLSTNTSQGGTLSLAGGLITYRPPPQLPPDGVDTAEYLVSDESGGTRVGTIIWSAQSFGANPAGVEPQAGKLTLTFQGRAQSEYQLQFRSNLQAQSAWTHLDLRATADSTGLHRFTVNRDSTQGYYRSIQTQALRPAGITRRGSQLSLTFHATTRGSFPWKLQARSSLSPDSPWQDYPNPRQPLRAAADLDGSVTFFVPLNLSNQFFRASSR